jgi:hypothetical protein
MMSIYNRWIHALPTGAIQNGQQQLPHSINTQELGTVGQVNGDFVNNPPHIKEGNYRQSPGLFPYARIASDYEAPSWGKFLSEGSAKVGADSGASLK